MGSGVSLKPLARGKPFVELSPQTENERLMKWAAGRRAEIDAWLVTHGAVLFRGFSDQAAISVGDFMTAVYGPLMSYKYRSTPRTEIGEKVYTATEYPRDHTIPLHNENAYQRSWPMRLGFQCVQPASAGGRTPIAAMRDVTARIGVGLMDEFTERQVLYVRNYGSGVDLPWETVFQTTDRSEVDAFCETQGIQTEWGSHGDLRTRQVCQASARHPVTGEKMWFNQAHLFHISSLAPELRADLLSVFEESELPRNAYFGDGAPIETSALEQVRSAFAAESTAFDWQRGDILLIDNMLVAHGREPFEGERRVLVAMGVPYRAASPV